MNQYLDQLNGHLKRGNEAWDNRDYSEARAYYGYGFDLADDSNDSANREMFRYYYAWCDQKLGNYILALRNYQYTLKNMDVLKENFEYAYDYNTYYRMAETYEELGQWLNVRESLYNALKTEYTQKSAERQMFVKWYIADSHRERGEFKEALELYSEVKNFYSNHPDRIINLEQDEAKLYILQGNFDKAFANAKKHWGALQVDDEHTYLRNGTVEILTKILELRNTEEELVSDVIQFTEPILQTELQRAEEEGDRSYKIELLKWIFNLELITNKTPSLSRVLELLNSVKDDIKSTQTSLSLNDFKNLVNIYLSLADYNYDKIEQNGPKKLNFEVLDYYKTADTLIDKVTAKLTSPTDRRDYHTQFTRIAYRIFGLYQIIYQDFWEDFLYQGLGMVEKYKGYDLFQSLDDVKSRKQHMNSLNELEYQLTLKKKYYAHASDEDQPKLKQEVEEIEDNYFDAQNEMLIERRSWISVFDPVKMMEETMEPIQPLLDQFPYGIMYMAMDQTMLYIIVFVKNQVKRFEVEFSQAKLDKAEALLTVLREKAAQIQSKDDLYLLDKILKKLSKWLSKYIVNPELGEFISSLEYLTIIPSGIFINFPFEILTINGEYFGTKFKLSREFNLKFIAKQMQDVVREKRNNRPIDSLKNPGDMIFVSNPNYQESMILDKSDIEFYIVPNSMVVDTEEEYTTRNQAGEEVYLSSDVWSMDLGKTEVQAITRNLQQQNVPHSALINQEVSKDKLLELLNDKIKIFHFAGHAIFDDDNPQFSKLVLRDSKTLIPLDLMKYSFGSNPLFIFSACESGVSEVKEGDEPFGFLRFAKIVQAQNIIFSLWPVLSRPTTHLMVDFYNNLVQGDEISEALRKARVNLIKDTKEGTNRLGIYSDLELVYWSPFSFIGLPFYFYNMEVEQ